MQLAKPGMDQICWNGAAPGGKSSSRRNLWCKRQAHGKGSPSGLLSELMVFQLARTLLLSLQGIGIIAFQILFHAMQLALSPSCTLLKLGLGTGDVNL